MKIVGPLISRTMETEVAKLSKLKAVLEAG